MSNASLHHVDTATLVSFSAGTLNGALSAVVASHVSVCADCARELSRMDLVGASLLAGMPVPLHQDTGPSPMPVAEPSSPPATRASKTTGYADTGDTFEIPFPLRRHFGLKETSIRWRQLAPGVWHHRFKQPKRSSGDLRLLKIAPGYRMLEHGHGGTELTLVLDGAFSDSTGEYLRNDIQEVSQETEHCPVADQVSGCICLIASEEPARFRGLIGKLVQVWTGL